MFRKFQFVRKPSLFLFVAAVLSLAFAQPALAAPPGTPSADASAVLATLKAIVLSIWSYDGVKVIALSVIANTALAVALAVKQRNFTFQRLGDFLFDLIPYVLVYYVFKLFGDAIEFGYVAISAWAFIEAQIASAIVQNLEDLGFPIPVPIGDVTGSPDGPQP
jgi:hypothetical protein